MSNSIDSKMRGLNFVSGLETKLGQSHKVDLDALKKEFMKLDDGGLKVAIAEMKTHSDPMIRGLGDLLTEFKKPAPPPAPRYEAPVFSGGG